MLVLTRRIGESVRIDGDIEITLLEIKGDSVRIGVKAPRETRIQRTEIIEAVVAENVSAAAETDAGAEEAIAVGQPTVGGVEGRGGAAIQQHAGRGEGGHGVSMPSARNKPRALCRVSCSSRLGSESATMPAPARKRRLSPSSIKVRIRMLLSSVPSWLR